MITAEYRHFFEIGLGFWLSNGGNPNPGYHYFVYGNWMGGSIDPTARPSMSNPHTRLRAMAQGFFLKTIRGIIFCGFNLNALCGRNMSG